MQAVRGGAVSVRNAGKVYDPEGLNVVALEDVIVRNNARPVLCRRWAIRVRQDHAA